MTLYDFLLQNHGINFLPCLILSAGLFCPWGLAIITGIYVSLVENDAGESLSKFLMPLSCLSCPRPLPGPAGAYVYFMVVDYLFRI